MAPRVLASFSPMMVLRTFLSIFQRLNAPACANSLKVRRSATISSATRSPARIRLIIFRPHDLSFASADHEYGSGLAMCWQQADHGCTGSELTTGGSELTIRA